jgi:hypothetical protein
MRMSSLVDKNRMNDTSGYTSPTVYEPKPTGAQIEGGALSAVS